MSVLELMQAITEDSNITISDFMSILDYYTTDGAIHSIIRNNILTIFAIDGNGQSTHPRILLDGLINF